MKRYTPKIKRPPPGMSLRHWISDSVTMEESGDGEWVRFEDADKALELLQLAFECLGERIEALEDKG